MEELVKTIRKQVLPDESIMEGATSWWEYRKSRK
jgi:hypothetical protein